MQIIDMEKKGNVVRFYLGENGKQWGDELNVNAESLYRRKYRGWTIEKILTTPIRKQGKRSEY